MAKEARNQPAVLLLKQILQPIQEMKTQPPGLKLSNALRTSNCGSGLFKQKTEPDTSLKVRLQQTVIAIKTDKIKGTKA